MYFQLKEKLEKEGQELWHQSNYFWIPSIHVFMACKYEVGRYTSKKYMGQKLKKLVKNLPTTVIFPYKSSMLFFADWNKFLTKFSQNFHKISTKIPQNFHKISTKFPQKKGIFFERGQIPYIFVVEQQLRYGKASTQALLFIFEKQNSPYLFG